MESVLCATCEQEGTDVLFSKWGHNLVRCSKCGLVYVNPRSFDVEADDYFRGPYLTTIEENGWLKPGIQYLYSQVIRNLNTILVPGRLLDVGCAMGHFMVQARQMGWKVHGVECSRYAADYALQRWGLHVQPACDIRGARFPDNHFDAGVLIEVAEHLPHPRTTFTEIFRLLKPGGILYVTTPNFASFRSLLQRELWAAVIPTGHLYYFTADSLGNLLTSIGFRGLINLTTQADFESELEAVCGLGAMRLDQAEVDVIRRCTALEDASRIVNGRGDGLVMWASKPRSSDEAMVASLRYLRPLPPVDGKLVRAPGDTAEDQKVYLVCEGRKHWVKTVDWLHQHGMRLDQTIQVEHEVLDSILTGPELG